MLTRSGLNEKIPARSVKTRALREKSRSKGRTQGKNDNHDGLGSSTPPAAHKELGSSTPPAAPKKGDEETKQEKSALKEVEKGSGFLAALDKEQSQNSKKEQRNRKEKNGEEEKTPKDVKTKKAFDSKKEQQKTRK